MNFLSSIDVFLSPNARRVRVAPQDLIGAKKKTAENA